MQSNRFFENRILLDTIYLLPIVYIDVSGIEITLSILGKLYRAKAIEIPTYIEFLKKIEEMRQI